MKWSKKKSSGVRKFRKTGKTWLKVEILGSFSEKLILPMYVRKTYVKTNIMMKAVF